MKDLFCTAAGVIGSAICWAFGGWDAAKAENLFVAEGTTLVSPATVAAATAGTSCTADPENTC